MPLYVFNSILVLFRKFKVWGFRGVLSYFRNRMEYRRARKALLAHVGPDLTPKRGITVIGPLSKQFSNSRTLLDFVFALRKAEIPFQTFDTAPCSGTPPDDYAEILTPRNEFVLRRYSHVVEMFHSPLPDGLVRNRARIAFWEGEHGLLDAFPYLASPDSVIAMSDFNAVNFRKELPAGTPVYKIPYPIEFPESPTESTADIRREFGIGEEDFVVFFNFDYGSFCRKNPQALLRAFAKAFPSDPCAKLFFKTNHGFEHKQQENGIYRLARELGIHDRFIAVDEYLPRTKVLSITNACDVYASLHRAEGFGMGMAEALSLGKPVVATDWSASTEFVRPEHAMPIPYRMVPIRPGEYFESMKEWAEADVDSAASALRRLFDDPELRAELGRKARSFVEEHFSTDRFRRAVEDFLDGKGAL